MKYTPQNNRWLIAIDLDGTLLKTPLIKGSKQDFIYPEINIKYIKKCIELGHIVVIVTGRPWRSTKPIWENLGLKTLVCNYNGAHIHDPLDNGFHPIHSSMNREIFSELFNDKKINLKKSITNFIIENEGEVYICNKEKSEDDFFRQFHINKDYPDVKVCGWKLKLDKNPRSAIFKLNTDIDRNILMINLKRRYGDAFIFRYWLDAKERKSAFLEVNQKSITKAYAMRYIAAYYNISHKNTIAFGDGENDIEMLYEANVGVAMKNGGKVLKSYADDITDYTNDEGGVGEYLKDFFNLD